MLSNGKNYQQTMQRAMLLVPRASTKSFCAKLQHFRKINNPITICMLSFGLLYMVATGSIIQEDHKKDISILKIYLYDCFCFPGNTTGNHRTIQRFGIDGITATMPIDFLADERTYISEKAETDSNGEEIDKMERWKSNQEHGWNVSMGQQITG